MPLHPVLGRIPLHVVFVGTVNDRADRQPCETCGAEAGRVHVAVAEHAEVAAQYAEHRARWPR